MESVAKCQRRSVSAAFRILTVVLLSLQLASTPAEPVANGGKGTARTLVRPVPGGAAGFEPVAETALSWGNVPFAIFWAAIFGRAKYVPNRVVDCRSGTIAEMDARSEPGSRNPSKRRLTTRSVPAGPSPCGDQQRQIVVEDEPPHRQPLSACTAANRRPEGQHVQRSASDKISIFRGPIT